MHRHRAGFTLVELLAVTVILGMLAVMAVPRVAPAKDRALRASVVSDLRNLATQQELHHERHGVYASDPATLGQRATPGVEITVVEAGPLGWAARGSHARAPGEHCGIYVGAANPVIGSPASSPGGVTCTF